MGVVDYAIALRNKLISEEGAAIPEEFSGISKKKISKVLQRIDRKTPDMVDAVFALLDTGRPIKKYSYTAGIIGYLENS